MTKPKQESWENQKLPFPPYDKAKDYFTKGDIKFIRSLLSKEKERWVKELKKEIEINVGTVMYTNPDGKKYRVYNANHIYDIINLLKTK